jgi:hypothetical protein
MKKLFFTALVAVAAVGGAYATTYYLDSPTGSPFQCDANGSDCISTIGARDVYNGAGNLVEDYTPFENKEFEAL